MNTVEYKNESKQTCQKCNQYYSSHITIINRYTCRPKHVNDDSFLTLNKFTINSHLQPLRSFPEPPSDKKCKIS